jgi:hypothetical protein
MRNDCPDAEIRDLLCNAVHETLAKHDHERVHAHIAGCADCTAELALLHRARAVLARGTPAIDAARIAAAIPAPQRRRWSFNVTNLRVAATIAVIAIGAASLSLALQERGLGNDPDSTVASIAGAPDAHTLSFAGRLSTLEADELEQLLAEMDDFDGGTPAEPAAVLPVPAWDGGTP